jgi:hypothetical protein
MTDTMIERLETAAWNELLRQTGHGLRVDPSDGEIVGAIHMPSVIRAVLTAMREPTEAMISPDGPAWNYGGMALEQAWKSMIDAALKEG